MKQIVLTRRKQEKEVEGAAGPLDEKAIQLNGHIPLPGVGTAEEGDASVRD